MFFYYTKYDRLSLRKFSCDIHRNENNENKV